ncbi:MAG: hypothetical protein Q8M29_18590 [Bacteroidota bacterium]|nr:hypothetical protein [Bacteroidota bacterium]
MERTNAKLQRIGTKVETGIEKSGIESETEINLFVVVLVHATEKKKNVILEKNAGDKNNQLKIQQHYAQLLKLPVLM